MNNSIVKVFALVVMLFCFATVKAQMPAAQRVEYEIRTSVDLDITARKVWKALNDVEQISVISHGYIISLQNEDDIMPISRTAKFADGTARKEVLTQVQDDNRIYVYKIDNASLPAGLKGASIGVFVRNKDEGKSQVEWMIKIDGDKKAKEAMIKQLTKEVEEFKKGFKALSTN